MAKCAETVWSSEGLATYTYPCSRQGKINEAGKWWCKQHAPSSQKARDKARHQKFERRWAEQDARLESDMELRRKGQRYDVLLAAAEQGRRLADIICNAVLNDEIGHGKYCGADPCCCWVALAPDARAALNAATEAAQEKEA